ncbi:MAG: WbqC family protein [Rhodothermales bacterium]|nr:WbqC family protein [Rhodothermales bacterium]MBO6779786.1 WbqC family protein [Rhodothermales bacterium]
MTLTCAPDYFPSAVFWAAASHADRVELLMDAPYVRQTRHNRARIRTPQGTQWLTVPVERGQDDIRLCAIRISQEGAWWRQHPKALRYNYGAAPYYEHFIDALTPRFNPEVTTLGDLSAGLIRAVADLLNLRIDIAPGTSRPRSRIPVIERHGARFGVDVSPIRYRQVFEGFEPDLCILDLLFNLGPRALDLLHDAAHLRPMPESLAAQHDSSSP